MNKFTNIPIFPLKSIILPGGQFPLRIFERRYIDMIKNSLKKNTGFVIALTKKDADYISSVHEYGCYVEIVDWSQLDGGLLGITVEGKTIVKLKDCVLDEANLLKGNAIAREQEIDHIIPKKYQILSKFYKKIYPEIKAYIFHNNSNYNDANWVGFRLIECLPIEINDKADLISTNEPLDRLEKIFHIIKRIYPKELNILD